MKKSNKLFLKLMKLSVFLVLGPGLFAQGSITGTVSDSEGPLGGATVRIVGSGTGTVTDFDGAYTLNADPGTYTLEASFTGFETMTQSVTVGSGQTIADFTMSSGLLLGDIVVTGTRSRPRTAISSPVPIDNFVAAVIDKSGNGDLTENLKNIVPSFSATPLTVNSSFWCCYECRCSCCRYWTYSKYST